MADLFNQNSEIFYINDKNVEKNTFIGAKTYINEKIPTFEEIRDKLPEPIWEGHESAVDCYYFAWQIAFRNIKRATDINGFAADLIDTAFNGRTFMWDSCFMTAFGKYADRIFSFQHTLDNFYAKQHRDGYICKELDEETGKDAYTRFDLCGTGPDILPMAEYLYYKQYGDKERIKAVFYPLLAYQRWLRANHTWQNGAYFTNGIGDGMDNTPRLEEGYSIEFSHGFMSWIDITMQQYINDKILIYFAALIGEEALVGEEKEEIDLLSQLINEKMWDDENKFYTDLWRGDRLCPVKHIGSYWTLLGGIIPDSRLDDFVAHLENENEFKTKHRVPSLSKDHPMFSELGNYWKGGVWAPTNYMLVNGLRYVGKHELAFEIAKNHLDNVVKCFENTGTLWENYKPVAAEPGVYPDAGEAFSRRDFVGWTGLVPIAQLIENVFGITYDSETNTITWRVKLTERHGVKKYPFGKGGEAELICEARSGREEKPEITVKSNTNVTVRVICNGREYTQNC